MHNIYSASDLMPGYYFGSVMLVKGSTDHHTEDTTLENLTGFTWSTEYHPNIMKMAIGQLCRNQEHVLYMDLLLNLSLQTFLLSVSVW